MRDVLLVTALVACVILATYGLCSLLGDQTGDAFFEGRTVVIEETEDVIYYVTDCGRQDMFSAACDYIDRQGGVVTSYRWLDIEWYKEISYEQEVQQSDP